jgi:hypothetical protein
MSFVLINCHFLFQSTTIQDANAERDIALGHMNDVIINHQSDLKAAVKMPGCQRERERALLTSDRTT